ncbi:MAG TPA: hypothetical protein VFU15_04705, partial [Bacteroidia bacterium]|nr:hypothetical protein [Bacteroidia bacterium]
TEYVKKGENVMLELSSISDASHSSRIRFFRNLAAINYHSAAHDFEKAEKFAGQLLSSVEKDRIVLSRSNRAGANMELANVYLNMGKYDRAVEYATKAAGLFKTGMINQLNAYILLFFSYFRNKQFSEAEDVLRMSQNHRLVKHRINPMMHSRVHLLRAAFTFFQGDVEQSSRILNRNTEPDRDKDGWMPGFYMLDLLILMEKKAVELASYRLEAFRKMIRRYQVCQREMRLPVITSILKDIVKNDFDFRNVLPAHEPEIKKLSEAREQYYWNPAGYEVIRFDEWLMRKVS